jgi:hypothetical protein
VHQQLRFNAMDARGILQRLDHVRQQAIFKFRGGVRVARLGGPHVQVADHTLVTFVDEKRVAADAAAEDGSVTWQDLGIDVAQDHLRRSPVVP